MSIGKNFYLEKKTFRSFLLIGITISIKFLEDKYYKNDYYAKVGGVTLKELNFLEKEFLKLIDFSLYIGFDTFSYYQKKIMEKG